MQYILWRNKTFQRKLTIVVTQYHKNCILILTQKCNVIYMCKIWKKKEKQMSLVSFCISRNDEFFCAEINIFWLSVLSQKIVSNINTAAFVMSTTFCVENEIASLSRSLRLVPRRQYCSRYSFSRAESTRGGKRQIMAYPRIELGTHYRPEKQGGSVGSFKINNLKWYLRYIFMYLLY